MTWHGGHVEDGKKKVQRRRAQRGLGEKASHQLSRTRVCVWGVHARMPYCHAHATCHSNVPSCHVSLHGEKKVGCKKRKNEKKSRGWGGGITSAFVRRRHREASVAERRNQSTTRRGTEANATERSDEYRGRSHQEAQYRISSEEATKWMVASRVR